VGTPAPASPGNAERGKQLFGKDGCFECHGSEGQITSRSGPALVPNLISLQRFTSFLRHPGGSMPPYTEKVMPETDVVDVYSFLQAASRSHTTTKKGH